MNCEVMSGPLVPLSLSLITGCRIVQLHNHNIIDLINSYLIKYDYDDSYVRNKPVFPRFYYFYFYFIKFIDKSHYDLLITLSSKLIISNHCFRSIFDFDNVS